MTMTSFGTGAAMTSVTGAAASNPFFETAASPTSLASVMRSNTVLRDSRHPISFPFRTEQVVGYGAPAI